MRSTTKSPGIGSRLGTYNEFHKAQYDRKHDSVAESLFRIHDKLTRGKERRTERIQGVKRQLSERHLALSDRVSHLSDRDFEEGEQTLLKACEKAIKADQKLLKNIRN